MIGSDLRWNVDTSRGWKKSDAVTSFSYISISSRRENESYQNEEKYSPNSAEEVPHFHAEDASLDNLIYTHTEFNV